MSLGESPLGKFPLAKFPLGKHPPKPSGAQTCLVTLAIGFMMAALLACNLAWASQVWLPTTRQTVWMCASVRPSIDFRVAVWWQRRYLGKSGEPLRARIQSNIACAFVPWASFWEDAGALESSE